MNRRNNIVLILASIVLVTHSSVWAAVQSRQQIDFDWDWKFTLVDPPDAQFPEFNDSEWRNVDLPHDWSIEGPYDKNAPTGGSGGFLPTGIGWYRKHFTLPVSASESRVYVEFDGVYENSEVWINGHHLGKRPYGYISFQYDLTSHIVAGDNVIAVRVDNLNQPNTRWYSGSGIYRHVRLVVTNKVHISHWGVYVTTPEVSNNSATVVINTMIENLGSLQGLIKLRSILIDSKGNTVAQIESEEFQIPKNKIKIEQKLQIDKPSLWSIETPILYTLQTVVLQDEISIDEINTSFGIRRIEYDVNRGFL